MVRRLSNKGFSLIELMVVIAILAIGLAIAVPSFRGMGRSNSVKAEARQLKNLLEKARMDAVRRNQPLTATISGNNCTVRAPDGAIVFATDFNRAQVDTGGADQIIVWNNKGMTTNNCTIGFVGENATYNVIVSLAGNIRIARQ